MALLFYFPGSQIPLSIAGLMKKVNYHEPNPDLGKSIHVIVPVKNEEQRIPYALGSLLKQDYKNLELTIVNNLSSDKTYEVSKRLSQLFPKEYETRVLDNPKPGKTPSIKMAIKERPDCDLTFILDADTYLTDSNYISTLAAQFDKPKVGSAFGTVKPIRRRGVEAAYKRFVVDMFSEKGIHQSLDDILAEQDTGNDLLERMMIAQRSSLNQDLEEIVEASKPTKPNFLDKIVISQRAALYSFDQRFIKRGQMGLYGTTTFPIGCGVMYDTELLSSIFSEYEKTLGDNLTSSEDIFLGFAIRERGRCNFYVPSIHMETAEPKLSKYFRQSNMWNSSFMQSSFYFKKHVFQMFSTKGEYEKAMGASILFPLLEKVTYPALLGYFAAIQDYEVVLGALGFEIAAYALINLFTAEKGYHLKSLADLIHAESLRLASFFSELYTSAKFAKDVITNNRNWRK
jgi:glycosyltransferase involved in cell wall biosynthesis